jgi:hypothetical protein
MENTAENTNPTPALPLDYFEQRGGPWLAVVRWMAAAMIAWAGISIASDLFQTLFYFWQTFSASSAPRIVFVDRQTLMVNALPNAAAAALLLVGSIMILFRRPRTGRQMVLWACAALIAIDALHFVMLFFSPFLRRPNLYAYGKFFVPYQIVSSAFSALLHSLVPLMFILALRQRQVRDVFEAS